MNKHDNEPQHMNNSKSFVIFLLKLLSCLLNMLKN